ncbi:MAG: hypothetical protein KDB07_11115, partial [Planctomycetes bacterium]|nr:hypothetical protein [Planctomycetota bacterium]
GQSTAQIALAQLGYYSIRLEVRDGGGRISYKLWNLRVVNQAPVADAGEDQTVQLGSDITLNASRSRDANDTLSFRDLDEVVWTQVSGPVQTTITELAHGLASVSGANAAGTYVFKVSVKDRNQALSSDTLQITILDEDTPYLSVNLGPNRHARVGQVVDLVAGLQGVSSQANFAWTVSNPALVNVISTDANRASMTFLGVGNFKVVLSATEGGRTTNASVWVSVSDLTVNDVPVLVVSAPQSVQAGTSFTISTTESRDMIGLPLEARFEQVSGPALFAVSSQRDSVTYTTTQGGVATSLVRVSDGSLDSIAQVIKVLVHPSPRSLAISRAAGPRELVLGQTLNFDLAASSDADGHNLSFFVEELLTKGASLSLSGTTLNFTPAIAGLHRFPVTAYDDFDVGSSEVVEVMVRSSSAANTVQARPAKANIDLNFESTTELSDFGSASPSMDLLWVQSSGSPASIASPSLSTTEVTLPQQAGTYEFALYALVDSEWQQLATTSIVAEGAEPILVNGNSSDSGGCALALDGPGYALIGFVCAIFALFVSVLVRRKKSHVQA